MSGLSNDGTHPPLISTHQQQPTQEQTYEQQQSETSKAGYTMLLNAGYNRHQSIKVQALTAYQQLIEQYPGYSSSKVCSQDQQQHSGPTPDIPVLEAALLIAKHAYPELDPQSVKQQLDNLAAEVSAALPSDVRYPLRVIKEINRVLYEVHGFRGNEQDYYNPDNSYINRVLETKLGVYSMTLAHVM